MRKKENLKKETMANEVEKISKKLAKKSKKRESLRLKLSKMFNTYLIKAGIESDAEKVSKSVFYFAIFLNFLVSIYLIFYFSVKFNYPLFYVSILLIILWAFVFLILVFVLYLLFFLSLDLRIFKRTMDIEDVLPDFLELTSANIRAGMPIDQALWFSVRPRFGVLAKEIEMVAKETLSGEQLEVALMKFTAKYNSSVLDRSINLLIEGMTAGGELGYLLNKISSNIQESRTIKKEMSANVTTYVIFITFASIVAAPVLFALSGQLLVIVSGLMQKMSAVSGQGATTGVSLSTSGTSISFSDFRLFSVITLIITAFFSSIIVAIIKRGNIKAGISYIPSYIITSMIIYWIASIILKGALGGIV